MKFSKYSNYKLFKLILPLFIIILSLFLYQTNDTSNYKNQMTIHYIDVGQGDCILIQVNNKNLLIDSGPSSNRKSLLDYLENLNIKKLDYIIATHPHEDHIGNMDTIIRRYNIGSFYSPKVTHSSTTFENMISSLVDKNLKINILNRGVTGINLGENTSVSVYSPLENLYSDNLNDYSPIIKITFLNNSFLFTGDAEISTENTVLSQNENLKCDILKIGHHGSSTSTSPDFITAVNPSVAIISVGKNNPYGHPTPEIISLLNSLNIKTIRTDINGSIIAISDGSNIKIYNIK
ncbi:MULTISPECIES: ComEC/Rec2 family competence protein [unclassified Clostridium]|uniref:ComEC/Rec2 family competence protein n=1 Tax=Clostridium TaxID=1485 RepID=UPI001C8B3ED8|nr:MULTISPECIES: ComEC/Rec2 family competence protein [unclassified Clostridium]MBX9137535.1 MBL fold metallo-hydrolase [Clostridium sp. K12(2020)]MBX9144345.1 MBL fold metallo-hydrolase [Clostridium sp. K13]MDU2291541.1 ComEC/Rec2 family competence protein [Clostridium celatum]MDU4325190.1 ComEC/Rec2 family competence protein [Clostridium celatum]